KGSFWHEKDKKKESSGTRLDKLAKGAFVKVGSMAWDVWIHACSHGLLGSSYGFKDFHGCIATMFFVE
ncbi:hypothetical protein, partial [Klebsiella pneumoniae]|uniref:hypothetical protein n=1 Tax=Klebsiella pneumoniae TaxID=573 RepID=UPI003530EEFF